MWTRTQIKKNLLGSFEITLFMGKGVTHFESSRDSAIKSFLLPLVMLPIVLYMSSSNWEVSGFSTLYVLDGLRIILTLALFLGLIHVLTKQLGRDEHFYRFVTAYNWLNIPMALFLIPMSVALMTGMATMQDMDSLALFVVLLGYVYTAFIATYSFKLPWELGTVIAFFGMHMHQASGDIGDYIQQGILRL